MLQVSGALPEGRTAIFQKMFRLWCFDDRSESTVYHITPKSPKSVQLSLGLASHPQPHSMSPEWKHLHLLCLTTLSFMFFLELMLSLYLCHKMILIQIKITSLTRGHRAFIDSFCATRDENMSQCYIHFGKILVTVVTLCLIN